MERGGITAKLNIDMNNKLSILKTRLQLKRIEVKIEYEVHLNFGYSPNDAQFDELVEKRNHLSDIARKNDPDWWDMYDLYKEKGNCKKIMVFL